MKRSKKHFSSRFRMRDEHVLIEDIKSVNLILIFKKINKNFFSTPDNVLCFTIRPLV